MAQRTLHEYALSVVAGPGRDTVYVHVTYLDDQGETIGSTGATQMSFGFIWADIARIVKVGAEKLNLELTPFYNVSPQVDLT